MAISSPVLISHVVIDCGHVNEAASLYYDHVDHQLSLLVLSTMANHFYKRQHYTEAMNAFHLLCAVDHELYWDGLCGSICGVIKCHAIEPSQQDQDSMDDVRSYLSLYSGSDVNEIQSAMDALVSKR